MPAFTNPSQLPRKPVILGIDWGSTAIRLYLYFVKEMRTELIVNLSALSKCDETRYQLGSWSGYINISDEGPVYTGDDVPATLQIPAKLILGRGRGIDETNPLLTEVKRRQGNVKFERRCQEGLEEIVKSFASQVQERCEKKNDPLEIVDIGLTVPAHWTLEEEDVYASLIRKAFPRSSRWNCRLKNVYFMSEIEAFAHFFFEDPDRADRYLGNRVSNFVLFLDFGGHSMNGCLFYVRRACDRFVFIRVTDPFGTVGGSAQWEAAVGDFCTSNTLSGGGSKAKVTPEVRNSLLKKFREEIRMLECDHFEEIELRIKPPKGYAASSRDIWTTISANQSAQFFHDAMDEPLKRAKVELKRLASRVGRIPDVGVKIIVSGGTAKNETVQGTLNGFCSRAGLPPPIFVHQNFGSYETFNIAKGAALATASQMSMLEFMENGAAFGIQMLQGPGNPDRLWDNNAVVVLADKGRSWMLGRSYVVKLSGADRLKIICDPFWTSNSRGTQLDSGKTYDILDLLVPEAGTWKFSLSMGSDGRSLLLQQSMVTERDGEIHPTQSKVLKMDFRRSSGCFLIDVDGEIDSLDCGLGLEKDGKFVALTSELERSLEIKIKQTLEARPYMIHSCVFAYQDVGSPLQRKRRFIDVAGGKSQKRLTANAKSQHTRILPARRRPIAFQRDSEEEEDRIFQHGD